MFFEAIFYTCTAAALYHHAAYPLLLRWLAARQTQSSPEEGLPSVPPSIAVIVPAYNEAAFVARKIENLAALRYAAGRCAIVIACDGCTDRTAAIATEAALHHNPSSISIAVHEPNMGKIAILNRHIQSCDADLIALTDASALLPEDALEKAAAHFADPVVGVVCGTYALPSKAAAGERLYWAYQCRIKAAEAALGAPFGAHGAFYTFRRSAWTPLAPDTINDDVILPMTIIGRGYRGIYDQSIVAEEAERSNASEDFRRRIRLGAGNLQQAIRLRELVSLKRPGLAFVFLSGKALRAIMPLLAAAGAFATAMLAVQGEALFQAVAVAALAAAVPCFLPYRWLPRILQPLSTLGRGYAAAFIGASSYLMGLHRRPWRRVTEADSPNDHFIPYSVERSKRLIDIVCALAALSFLCVLYPLLALAIKLSSPGPVFYRQMRVGRITPDMTELFWLIKFRTMRQDAEARSGPVWATDKDPRITPLGRFMRKTRLDEIPQCINVLKGEMSIVGPRPERPSFFRRLESEIPFYIERTYGLKPGITGLAQINQAYDQDIEDVRNKVLYDYTYALRLNRWRSWFACDFGIILKTAGVMVTGRGAK